MKKIILNLLDKLANISMLVGIAFILFVGFMDISITDIETIHAILVYSMTIWLFTRLMYVYFLNRKDDVI